MKQLSESKSEMMTGSSGACPHVQLRQLRGQRILRFLHRCLPLGRHYHPVLSLFNSSHGFVMVPFHGFQLIHPALWRKELTNILLLGPKVIPEFSLLEPVVRQLERGYLIDVGANIGLYTLLLRAVSALPIVAYEPQPFLSKLLSWTVALNKLCDVEVRPVACGAAKGSVLFHIGINGAIAVGPGHVPTGVCYECGANVDWEHEAKVTQKYRPVVEVPLTTLDDELADKYEVALLKIDAEGFEADILAGAKRVIERSRPCVFIEIHPEQLTRYGASVECVLEQLDPYYELEFWWFEHSGPHPKFHQSIAKCKKPKGHRYNTTAEMLAAVHGRRHPAQIYCLGRPKQSQHVNMA